MVQYKKKKNFLQTLFEFEWVKYVVSVLAIIVIPFPIGSLATKIPYLSELFALNKFEHPLSIVNRFAYVLLVYFCGATLIAICVAVVVIIMILKEVLIPATFDIIIDVAQSVMRDLHATKIMQYLPLTKEDWERFDVKTDEDAVHVLRNLVKTIGFNDDLINCFELRDRIVDSYRAFLNFKYVDRKFVHDFDGELICIDDNILIDVDYLILHPDSDKEFNELLELKREESKKNRERWLARNKS